MLRDELITAMEHLHLNGMRSVFDEVMAAGIKQRVNGASKIPNRA